MAIVRINCQIQVVAGPDRDAGGEGGGQERTVFSFRFSVFGGGEGKICWQGGKDCAGPGRVIGLIQQVEVDIIYRAQGFHDLYGGPEPD